MRRLAALASELRSLPPGEGRTARLRALLEHLGADADGATALRADLDHPSMVRLLAEMGLPDHTALLPELTQRAGDLLLPRLAEPGDLYRLLDDLDLDQEDAAWVRDLPPDLAEAARAFFAPEPRWVVEALRLLGHRATGVGLGRGLLRLGDGAPSPFLDLPSTLERFLADPASSEARNDLHRSLRACHAFLVGAHHRLETEGVDSQLVFQLDLLEGQLRRTARLAALLEGRKEGPDLLAELIEGSSEQASVRGLLRRSLRRLARKIVEHAGDSGEHYLVRTAREWKGLGWAAAGGGALTVGTALLKYGLVALPLAPMVVGLGLAANYFLSFAAMQLLGFALASKQPALTAAALAGALELEDGTEAEVEVVASLTRAQTIAMLGNVLTAIPLSLGVALLWARLAGQPPLSEATAHHGLEALHPFRSLTLLYAALTGVFLWLSSLGAGWAANWSAFRRLPEATAASPKVSALLGDRGAAWFGGMLHRHLPALAGYALLGLLLGFVPEVSTRFAGVALEVRHVTLQSAAWALDYGSLLARGHAPLGEALWGLAALPLIGFVNVAVSFALALRTAMRARNLDARGRWALRRAILRAFLHHPARFLWSPSE